MLWWIFWNLEHLQISVCSVMVMSHSCSFLIMKVLIWHLLLQMYLISFQRSAVKLPVRLVLPESLQLFFPPSPLSNLMYCLYGLSLLYTLLQRAVSTTETVLYIDKGVGNPSALTAEKWEIFFTIKKDSFSAGFASMLSLHAKWTGTGMCECEFNSVCVLFNATLRPWDVNLDSDSLTGEDSLLDCSLLSNPAADLLDEFAPVAFTAQPHKGKQSLLSLMSNQS